MSITKKGTVWELKNSIFVILSFIPVINASAFFYMKNRVEKKKWAIWGWVILILQLVSITLFMLFSVARAPSIDFSNAPRTEDYLGYNYLEKYGYEEYSKLPEYEEYLKAQDEWRKSPEYLEQRAREDNYNNMKLTVCQVSSAFSIFIYIITIFVVFIERGKYLKLLSNKEMKENIQDKLKNNIPSNNQNIAQNSSQRLPTLQKTDINLATEEELVSNLGITIVDAKKAIKHREENGSFASKDEFLNSINAKPHIVAKIQDFIIVKESNKTSNVKQSNKRRVDI